MTKPRSSNNYHPR